MSLLWKVFDFIREKEAYTQAQSRIDRGDLVQRLYQILLPLTIVMGIIWSDGSVNSSAGEIASLLSIALIITTQLSDLGKGLLGFLEMKARMHAVLKKLLDIGAPNNRPANMQCFTGLVG